MRDRSVTLVIALVLACDGATELPPLAVVTRDSVGVTITENHTPEWLQNAGYSLGAEPRLTIGLVDGDLPYLLDRVSGAVLMRDGNIIIANAGTSELRVFDQTGRHVRTTGGRGRGPGEYVRPAHLLLGPADSILVWDAGLSSVSVLDPQGTFVRREPLDLTRIMDVIGYDHASEGLTPLSDGTFVLHVTKRGNPHETGTPPGEIYRPPIGFYRFSRDLSRVDSLGWYGGLPQMYMLVDGQATYATMLVTTHARVAGAGDPLVIYAGNGDPYQVEAFDSNGDLQRIIRRLTPPRPIPSDEVQRLMDRREEREEDPFGFWARMRRVEAAMPEQVHYPAYSDLFADRLGYLWVIGHGESPSVYRPEGRWLGRVDVPGTPLDIGADHALFLTIDSLQVQRVELYDLYRR